MLTLEQVKAVNDGLGKADLNAALRPLEDAVDLRASELPKLDKKARLALVDGLKNGEDAKRWVEAIFHSNLSVRRFARRVFMGMGDDAAPVFAPLRARAERFWEEETRLSGWEDARAAAARREQWETIDNALELLLRADPAAFMEFYARRADDAPAPAPDENPWQTPQWTAWQQRNQVAQAATNEEIERLLRAEWGEDYVGGKKRGQLPMRVELELDARARQTPAIAQLWEEVGDHGQGDAWQQVAPRWEPVAMLMEKWGDYLGSWQPTGPTRRVTERVQPLLWKWIEIALDPSRGVAERERMVRRFEPHGGYWVGGMVSKEQSLAQLPALLLRAQAPLAAAIEAYTVSCDERSRGEILTGEAAIAKFWMNMLGVVSGAMAPVYDYSAADGQPTVKAVPAVDAEILRAITADLPTEMGETNHLRYTLDNFRENAAIIERAQRGEALEEIGGGDELCDGYVDDANARFKMNQQDALSPAQMQEMFGNYVDEEKYRADLARANAEIERVEAEIIAIADDERLQRLVAAPHPRAGELTIGRQNYLRLWTRELNPDDTAAFYGALLERARAPLWARYEAQLEAYRRMELEPIEPDVEQKLTAREAKEWRREERALRRAAIESDVLDIANLLIGGDLAARLKAIALADRPSCRGIRDQLEDGLAAELDAYPGAHTYQLLPMGFGGGAGYVTQVFQDEAALHEAWRNWKLGEEWDEVLAKIEARLERLKSEDWQRTNLERQLAQGFYRRGDFANFERYATRPNAFPQAVALAAVDLDDFEAWRVLVGVLPRWQDQALTQFWRNQQADETRRARALEFVAETLAQTNSDDGARVLLGWVKPLPVAEFEPYVSLVENALESALVPVKKWALSVLGKLDNFDRERAARAASEALWSENVGLAKDAAKFLSVLATQDADVAEIAWDALNDATSLENIGVCEAVYRALVKVKSKHKTLELSDAAREKLELLASAQNERFGKFTAKL